MLKISSNQRQESVRPHKRTARYTTHRSATRIHGFFIGRGDLTVALGARSSADASVKEAVIRIIAAAKKADKPVCVMVASAAEAKDFAGLGASAFIISSDQGQMRRAAAQTLTDFRNLVHTTDGLYVSQQ